jgi:hypothetical protein
MRTDSEIERDVVEELKWNPDLDSTDTAVKVKGGAVALAGFVTSYVRKTEAEAAENALLVWLLSRTTSRSGFQQLTSGPIRKLRGKLSRPSRGNCPARRSGSRSW